MKRFKQPKTAITVPRKELERIKQDIARETTEKAMLLILAAAVDTVGMTAEQAINTYTTADRYAGYIDDHLARLLDLQKTIEKGTGIKMKGWTK